MHASMSDEGFHEIQLNGKQLVFLFMAASIVAVVIFLCGVMVGRGVPTRASAAPNTSDQASLDPTASLQGLPVTPAVANDENAPITAQETLTYPTLLEDPNPPAETLAPPVQPSIELPVAAVTPRRPPPSVAPKPATPAAAPKPSSSVVARDLAPKPAAVPAPRAPRESVTPRESTANASLAEPAGGGFVVQVAAVRQRAEANTIARRLSSKGYPAFITTSGANFRVRVGKFDDRREAESIAGRLEREERFKPWITR